MMYAFGREPELVPYNWEAEMGVGRTYRFAETSLALVKSGLGLLHRRARRRGCRTLQDRLKSY